MQLRIKSKKYAGVYKQALEDGDISYSILYKDEHNKTRRETIGRKSMGITEIFAYNKRSEIIMKIKHGEDPQAQKKKVKNLQFNTVWEYYFNNKGLSDSTRYDYSKRWDKHLKTPFSAEVTLDGLKSFRAKLEGQKKPLSPRSIDLMISILGASIKYWNEHQDIEIKDAVAQLRIYDKNNLTKRDLKKRDVKRERYLSQDEVKDLKSHVSGEVLLFVLIALSTGARLGTIMSIRKIDIQKNKVKLINHKTGGDTYTGFLDAETMSLLAPVLVVRGQNDLVFTQTKASIQKRLQRVLNKLFNVGLDVDDRANRVVVHTLRHSFASHLVMNKTPILTVKDLMGHSDLNMTLRYAHLAPDAGHDAVINLWN